MNEEIIALVIGGTGGIGCAVSKLFSEQGIKVYATYYSNIEKAKKMEATLKECEMLKCDIRKEKDVREAVDHIIKKESKIDVVVNTATSKLKLKSFENLNMDELSEDIQVIVMGSINVCKQVVPLMKKNKSGVIINLLTVTVVDPPPTRMSSYVTAKSGLLGLTRSLSVELNSFNIRVVGISPSLVETELIKAFPAKLIEIEKEKAIDKMLIQPEDIAKVTFAILKDEKQYPNGKNVVLRTRKECKGYDEEAYSN